MPSPHRLAVAGAATAALGAAAIPPTPAAAEPLVSVVATESSSAVRPLLERAERAHARAVRRHVRLVRRHDRLRGERPDRGLSAELRDWSTAHLRAESRAQRRENRRLERRLERKTRRAARTGTGTGTASAAPAHLQAIAACESGGDPSAVGGGGAYGGK